VSDEELAAIACALSLAETEPQPSGAVSRWKTAARLEGVDDLASA
jgi:hypothetical protein